MPQPHFDLWITKPAKYLGREVECMLILSKKISLYSRPLHFLLSVEETLPFLICYLGGSPDCEGEN